MAVLLGS